MPKQQSLKEQLKPLFFPVEKVDISEILNDDHDGDDRGGNIYSDVKFSPQLSHWIVATDPKTHKRTVVNACSKGYHLISNEELMTPLIEKLDKEFSGVQAKVSQWGQSKFYVDFIFSEEPMYVIKGDKIFARMRLNNSYDGSVKYGFNFGFWREVCTNKMQAPIAGMNKNIKLRHTAGVGAGAIEKTIDIVSEFIENGPKILEGYKDLTKKGMSWDQALKMIETVTEETKFPNKRAEEVVAQLEKEKNLGLPVNAFLVYNAFNHALYAADTKQKDHKRDKVDLEVLRFITDEVS